MTIFRFVCYDFHISSTSSSKLVTMTGSMVPQDSQDSQDSQNVAVQDETMDTSDLVESAGSAGSADSADLEVLCKTMESMDSHKSVDDQDLAALDYQSCAIMSNVMNRDSSSMEFVMTTMMQDNQRFMQSVMQQFNTVSSHVIQVAENTKEIARSTLEASKEMMIELRESREMNKRVQDDLNAARVVFETMTTKLTNAVGKSQQCAITSRQKLGQAVNAEMEVVRIIIGQTPENCFYTDDVVCQKMFMYNAVGHNRRTDTRFDFVARPPTMAPHEKLVCEDRGNPRKNEFLTVASSDDTLSELLSSDVLSLEPANDTDRQAFDNIFSRHGGWSTPKLSSMPVYWIVKDDTKFVQNIREHIIRAFAGESSCHALEVIYSTGRPVKKTGRNKKSVIWFGYSPVSRPEAAAGFRMKADQYQLPIDVLKNAIIEGHELPNPFDQMSDDHCILAPQMYERPITWRARAMYDQTALRIWASVASHTLDNPAITMSVKQSILVPLMIWKQFIGRIREHYKVIIARKTWYKGTVSYHRDDKQVLGRFVSYFLPIEHNPAGTHYESYCRFVQSHLTEFVLQLDDIDASKAEEYSVVQGRDTENPTRDYDVTTKKGNNPKIRDALLQSIEEIFEFYNSTEDNNQVDFLLKMCTQLESEVCVDLGLRGQQARVYLSNLLNNPTIQRDPILTTKKRKSLEQRTLPAGRSTKRPRVTTPESSDSNVGQIALKCPRPTPVTPVTPAEPVPQDDIVQDDSSNSGSSSAEDSDSSSSADDSEQRPAMTLIAADDVETAEFLNKKVPENDEMSDSDEYSDNPEDNGDVNYFTFTPPQQDDIDLASNSTQKSNGSTTKRRLPPGIRSK